MSNGRLTWRSKLICRYRKLCRTHLTSNLPFLFFSMHTLSLSILSIAPSSSRMSTRGVHATIQQHCTLPAPYHEQVVPSLIDSVIGVVCIGRLFQELDGSFHCMRSQLREADYCFIWQNKNEDREFVSPTKLSGSSIFQWSAQGKWKHLANILQAK